MLLPSGHAATSFWSQHLVLSRRVVVASSEIPTFRKDSSALAVSEVIVRRYVCGTRVRESSQGCSFLPGAWGYAEYSA